MTAICQAIGAGGFCSSSVFGMMVAKTLGTTFRSDFADSHLLLRIAFQFCPRDLTPVHGIGAVGKS